MAGFLEHLSTTLLADSATSAMGFEKGEELEGWLMVLSHLTAASREKLVKLARGFEMVEDGRG